MHLCGKRLEDLTISDIQALKSNAVAEGRSLDYKRDLPAPGKLKDYQGDVSAFANSGGGYLIFGINENQGVPESIPGVVIDDQDELIRRLESTVRDGVESRVLGISYRAVPVDGGRHVFIAAIPAGWNPPHMVGFSGRFYARNAAGQHPMDVQEIRRAMLASDGQKSAIARWRTERLVVEQNRVVAELTFWSLTGAVAGEAARIA